MLTVIIKFIIQVSYSLSCFILYLSIIVDFLSSLPLSFFLSFITTYEKAREEKKNRHETCRRRTVVDREEIYHYNHHDLDVNSSNAFDYVDKK